ncbi:MAG: DNA polymerase III subunit delta [Clostridia bacterium]|nr:DNA polymerase III subunit delta [Clostridia bacterium]
MNHSEFLKLIRTGLPGGTFVLHGDEEYVKAQALKLIENSVEQDLRPFNVTSVSKPAPAELSEVCDTMPLFADRRFVFCHGLADGADAAKYFPCFEEHSPETVLLVVIKGKLAANSALLKFAKKRECEALFDPLSELECAKWCIKHCAEAGVNLDRSAASVLVSRVGVDMANLVSETDKLIDYVGPGGSVTNADIDVCSRAALDVRIFDMLDMFTYGKPADGIQALHALLAEGSEPMQIASFLSGRFKLMLEARRGIDAGQRKAEVASRMEGNKYANEKAYDAARRFTREELLSLISALSDTAFLKVSGAFKDDKYLELVLLRHPWRANPV